MLSRFLDWLDESAAGVIRLAYLLAGVIAVASYFSDGNVPRGLSSALNGVLPWALAGALEIHTYLSARRVRAAYQDMQAAALGSDDYERAARSMRVNLGILAGLLVFSMYNQLQYLAATWTPPHTPLTPPGPLAYVVRAIITPSAFMAAAFLAPIGEGMAAQVQREAHTLSRLAFKAAAAQWKRRLREMQQAQQDVTGALVGLVEDPSERRVIAGIWQAMHPGEQLATLEAPAQPEAAQPAPALEASTTPPLALEAAQRDVQRDVQPQGEPPTRPPTGPGSPAAARPVRTPRTERPAVLRLAVPPESRKAAAQARAKGVRTPRADTASREAEARTAWANGAHTISTMRAATGLSKTAAASWVRTLKAEHKASTASGKAVQ